MVKILSVESKEPATVWVFVQNLRLLVVDDKADEVSVVGGAVALPGQFDPCTAGAVGLERQDRAFT